MGKLFERSLSRWRGLSAVQKIVVCAAVVCVTLWGGSKEGARTNSAARMARQRLASGSARGLSMTTQAVNTVANVDENDIARGWRVVSETVGNALVPMPAGAVTNEPLRRRGGFDWAFRVEPKGWRFPYAGGALTGVTVLARGEVRPNARTTFFPVPLTNGVSLLPMARWNLTGGEPSVFAHAVTPSNSLLLAWWNALVGRDANCPTNLQMELFADGVFAWRTMDRATTYAPVFVFDWDGDGLANAVDPEPYAVNPLDAHGTNAEWYRLVCSNVFERVEGETSLAVPDVRFRADVSAQAYYFVDVVASDGPAPITFTADRASRLGSPVVIAQRGVTNHVPLLMGVRYTVSSSSPFELSVPEHVVVEQADLRNAIVQFPLTFSASEGFSGSERVYSMDVQPVDPGGSFSWGRTAGQGAQLLSAASGSSCGCWSGLGSTVTFGCGYNAGCRGGCEATGSYVLESASFAVTGGVCRCGFDDPPNDDRWPSSESGAAPGVSVSFSHSAVIFEETYQEHQGTWKPKRSTRVRLTVLAYGGSNGGTLAFTCRNLEKLAPIACGPLALPASMTLDAGEGYTASFLCEGVEASDGEEDVVVRGTFTENLANATPQQSETALSVVRVEVRATIHPPEPEAQMINRHAYGVCEKIALHQSPGEPQVCWSSLASGGTFDTAETPSSSIYYNCPLDEYEDPVRGTCEGVSYTPQITVREPQSVHAELLHGISRESLILTGVGKGQSGGIGMWLRLSVKPYSVSFSNIAVQEVPCLTYRASGYFQNPYYDGAFAHTRMAGAGRWWCVDNENGFSIDMAMYNDAIPWLTSDGHVTTDPTCAWTSGYVYIDNPFGWNHADVAEDDSPYKTFATDVQDEIMLTMDGTVGVRKLFNQVMRTTNDVVRLNGILIK